MVSGLAVKLSLVFFSLSVIYAFLGIYVYLINRKSKIHLLFLLITASMAVWANAFSISNSAATKEISEFWRGMAALGWGTFFSYIVHFFIVLTNYRPKLDRKFLLLIIYIPALFNILLYAPGGFIASSQYDMALTQWGWINTTPMDIWGLSFILYYVTFSLIAIGLLIRWYRVSTEKEVKKQALYLLLSSIAPFILGTFTEAILSDFLRIPFIDLTILFLIIPILTILVMMRKFGFFYRPVTDDRNNVKSGLLFIESRQKLFDMVSIIYFAFGAFLFALHHFRLNDPILPNFINSMVMWGVGILIINLSKITSNQNLQNTIFITIAILTIPFLMFRYSYAGGATVWALFLFPMLIAVVFKNRKYLITVTVVNIALQIFFMVVYLNAKITLDWTDYLIRILIIFVAFFLAQYLNQIYINRLEKNQKQIEIQELISNISRRFIDINSENYRSVVNKMLEECSKVFGYDRSYICFFDENDTIFEIRHIYKKWIPDEKETLVKKPLKIELGEVFHYTDYQWVFDSMLRGEMINIVDPTKLPQDGKIVYHYMMENHIQILTVIPIKDDAEVTGFIVFEAFENELNMPREKESASLLVIANLLSIATKKIDQESELFKNAYYDSITGLPNRYYMLGEIQKEIDEYGEENPFAIFILDVDNFSDVNNVYGHEVGDELIAAIAARYTSCIAECGRLSRFSGDNFMMMVPLTNKKNPTEIVEMILNKLVKPFVLDDKDFFITGSVGAAIYPQDAGDARTLIKNADLAKYESKKSGVNSYVFYSDYLNQKAINKTVLIAGLNKALDNNELFTEYQPLVDFKTLQIVGAEVLLRWASPNLGLISPAQFIPLAEQTGIIHKIGNFVLHQGMDLIKKIEKLGLPPIRISVNISGEQFRDAGFANSLKKMLVEKNIRPEFLELELTERIVMAEQGFVIGAMNQLKELGVTIAIDDFGIEYSSLSRLKILPIDFLKVDKIFIDDLEFSEKDRHIAQMISQLATILKIKVTAEGVETKNQFDFLRGSLYDMAQGYYFSRPISEQKLLELLTGQYKFGNSIILADKT